MIDPIVQEIIAREMPHARIMDPEEIKALRRAKDPRSDAEKRKDIIQGPSAETVIRKWGSNQPNPAPPIPKDELATVVVVYPKGRQETVIVNKTTGQIVATSG